MASTSSPGFISRIGIAFRAFIRALSTAPFASELSLLLDGQASAQPTKPPEVSRPVEAPKPQIHPLQLLTILQREGRLVDFLMEDIHTLPDAQIGSAVRQVHSQCAKALREQVTLEPVVSTPEEENMTISSGYDPAAIRVVGNLGANPPYTGTVRHRGWQATQLQLQPLPVGQKGEIIAPAEIEVK